MAMPLTVRSRDTVQCSTQRRVVNTQKERFTPGFGDGKGVPVGILLLHLLGVRPRPLGFDNLWTSARKQAIRATRCVVRRDYVSPRVCVVLDE